jgi:hypothetical protein
MRRFRAAKPRIAKGFVQNRANTLFNFAKVW